MTDDQRLPATVKAAEGARIYPRRARPATVAPQRDIAQDVTSWMSLAGRIGQQVDLDMLADETGVFRRRRSVPTAGALLGLALLYGPGGFSVRQLTESVERLALAPVSEPALVRCLHGSTHWLETVAEHLMIEQLLQRDAQASSSMAGLKIRPYEDWQNAAHAAKHFVLDFLPWAPGTFSAEQEQWLLCARWNFVAGTINSAHLTRDVGYSGAPTMERVRMLAHLISAVLPDRTA